MDYDLPKYQKCPEILSIPFLKGMRPLNHKYHDTCKGFREVNHAFHNPDRHTARSLAPASGHDRHNKLSSKNLLTVLLFLC